MFYDKLKPGDTIGIVAPSRPIFNLKPEIEAGIRRLKELGFRIRLGGHVDERFFFSAGTPEQRLDDIHEMFRDDEVRAIICATGGSSSNQLLDSLDYTLITKHPKIFMGYSDITALLLAINRQTGLTTYYGPTLYEIGDLDTGALDFLFKDSGQNPSTYPSSFKTIKSGKTQGRLVGGILSRFNSLLATPYMPDIKDTILFWEEVNVSPATIDFELQTLRLSGVFDNIKGMVIGHLSSCFDQKYPEDNRPIKDIVLDRTASFSFPIIQAEYFGHDIQNFYALPIGQYAKIDTDNLLFALT